MIFECRADTSPNRRPFYLTTVRGQSTTTILPTRCFMLRTPPIQLRPPLVNLRCPSVVTAVRAIIRRVIAIVCTRIIAAVTSKIPTIIRADREIVVIVDRITPSEIVVVVRRVVDGTIVEVEIGVTVPRTPTIRGRIPLNHFNLWLSPIGGYLKVFHVKLFATLCYNMKFHPSIFDPTCCRNLNPFGTVFCPKNKGIAVTCFLSVFIVIAAARCLALGVTDPNASCNRFFVVLYF